VAPAAGNPGNLVATVAAAIQIQVAFHQAAPVHSLHSQEILEHMVLVTRAVTDYPGRDIQTG
jgi:esterase/lipase